MKLSQIKLSDKQIEVAKDKRKRVFSYLNMSDRKLLLTKLREFYKL